MKTIKIWLDDVRKPPSPEYWHTFSVNETKVLIEFCEKVGETDFVLDLDHDLGDYANDGGDGIELVKWLAKTERFYTIKFHTMNPVGLINMKALIDRYWK